MTSGVGDAGGGTTAARSPLWDRIAHLVSTRPGRVLALALIPLVAPLLALPFMQRTHDVLDQLPAEAESVAGFRALAEHLPQGEASPVVLVVEGDGSVYEPATFEAMGDLSRSVLRLPQVEGVRSVAMPTGGAAPDIAADELSELADLGEGLEEAAQGARAIEGGIEEVAEGTDTLYRRVPEAPAGLDEAVAGARDLAAGARDLAAGAEELAAGSNKLARGAAELADGLAEARAGVGELRAGAVEARDGARRLRDDVAAPAEEAIAETLQALERFTVGATDPQYEEAYTSAAETYGLLTGRFPPGHAEAGEQIREDYDGLAAALDDLAGGLDQAVDGLGELDAGLAEAEAGARTLAASARQLAAGADELAAGARQVAAGNRQLADGLAGGVADAEAGTAQLRGALGELRSGVREELLPGASELADELEAGAEEVAAVDLEGLGLGLAADEQIGPFVLRAAHLDQMPEVREDLAFFVNGDETRTRLFVTLADSPFTEESLAAVPVLAETARMNLLGSPWEEAAVLPTGTAAALWEVDAAASADMPLIVLAVITGVFVVLSVLLRSVVAPLYMVASVLLTYGAALGAATIVFQGILGQAGLQWWIPPLLFVLLVALGVDYSIFLMGRVREEAATLITRQAVAEGVRYTGKIITSAGMILAATFGALMAAPLRSLAQMGFAAMVGILLDTFVVRALIVPSVAVLLGRHNWWPSARAAADCPLDSARGFRAQSEMPY